MTSHIPPLLRGCTFSCHPPTRQICDPRVLLHGRPDCEHAARGRPLDAWMWGGASMQEALDMFAQSREGARQGLGTSCRGGRGAG